MFCISKIYSLWRYTINGDISASIPEVSTSRNPRQKTRCQRQSAHPQMVKDNLSCRYALKNHTKKTIKAIRTAVKKAGPAQGYFVTPQSSVLLLSALISQSFSQRLIYLLRTHNPQKGESSPLSESCLTNYLKT